MAMQSGFIKRIRDIMRMDAGINGDAQRIEQMVWMLFLKVYDAKEDDWELNEDNYESIIPEALRWRNWAKADSNGHAMTGDKLLNFVNNILFPVLKGNLLFFDNTKPTTETWFYRVDIPSDRKHFSKTKPMELKHFDDCIAWWNDRKEIPDGENFKAQKFTAEYLLNEQGCNIDLCGYPHEEEEILDPLDTIREYQERRTTLNAEIDKVLAELEALLPGGVSE